ncbi:MAG TPA: hypothetical protein VFS76_02405 [Pyrinomonadaceae bacterium]|nr:hypothetical protein [Pyrinomonadaceae bacterium]
MPTTEDMRWFKTNFHTKIQPALEGTPFTLDLLTALACQETGEVWPILRKQQSLDLAKILELCVGDTLDSDRGRSAFPKTKDELVAHARGQEMFTLARQALVDMSQFVQSYRAAASRPKKFCHGFGIFQFDLQFFKTEPDYFLQKRYANFDECLQKALAELTHAKNGIGFKNRTSLDDREQALVAIAYNIGVGNFRASRGLKQGFRPPGGKFYGEQIFDFIRLSKTVAVDGIPPAVTTPSRGTAAVPPPSPVEASGRLFRVDVRETPLRLRSEPKIDKNNPTANVIARLPDGHIVQAVSNKQTDGFLEVETSLLGAHFRGFASAQFLKAARDVDEVPVLHPAPAPPTSGIVAVTMPRKPGTVTKRVGIATAHSLNEPDQPRRKGTTPDELRAELAAIIEYLGVDKPAHKRYKPITNATFCNIYAHDYCHLAGVYLPRVWWTAGAIERLAQGQNVPILLGNTIEEQRANDLFRWLRDFGLRFGWRQTGSLTSMQLEVNQGAIGVIVARRKNDGLSGHIAVVVPETDDDSAKRNAAGEVTAPLQSQAGRNNFKYGTGGTNWWKGDQFAESAFWLHS